MLSTIQTEQTRARRPNRGPRGGPQPPFKRAGLRGSIKGGIWHCDCQPSLPALFLKAKSGRRFYRCQRDKKKENACDFFLWAEDARPREINNVMTNHRSEQQQQQQDPAGDGAGPSTQLLSTTPGTGTKTWTQTKITSMPIRSRTRSQHAAAAAAASAAAGLENSSDSETASPSDSDGGSPSRASRQRKDKGKAPATMEDNLSQARSSRTLRSSDSQQRQEEAQYNIQNNKRKAPDDGEEFSDFSDDEVKELVEIEHRSGASTVGGRHRTRDVFATPNIPGGRSIFAGHFPQEHDDADTGGLPTPGTGRDVRRVLFKDAGGSHGGAGEQASTTTTTTTPNHKRQRNNAEGHYTPSHHQQSQTPGTSFSSDPGAGPDVYAEVMGLLQGEKISPSKLGSLSHTLLKHTKKMHGYQRGRDVSRVEIQRQKQRIAELEQRTAALENSRAMMSAALKSAQRREGEELDIRFRRE